MEFSEVVARRRSVRSFSRSPIEHGVVERAVSLAARSPSAGNSQGWNLVVWEGESTAQYWDVAFPADRRGGFRWPGLLDAPFVALVTADPRAYLERYSEHDKAASGWGRSTGNWPAPYWTVDASFATMTFMLALEDSGYSTLFFAHANEDALRSAFALPGDVVVLGTVAAGRAAGEVSTGRSAGRPRRAPDSIIHRERW